MQNTKHAVTHKNHVSNGSLRKTKFVAGLGAIAASILLQNAIPAQAVVPTTGTASLAWDSSPSSGVTGYRVYMGTASGNYTSNVAAGNATTTTLSGLTSGTTYFFAVKAYNASGVESAFSNEISFTPGSTSPGSVTIQLSVAPNGQAVLTVQGLAGHTYNIEATQDLTTWSTLGTATVGAGGTGSYTDTTAPSVLKRFYRTRDLQP